MSIELVPVFNGKINGENQLLCDARILHNKLGVGRDFSNWLKNRISEYGFVENQDYIIYQGDGIFAKIGENPLKDNQEYNTPIRQNGRIEVLYSVGENREGKIHGEIFDNTEDNQEYSLIRQNGRIKASYSEEENKTQKSRRGGDRRRKEYHITLDMAKELAMVEKTDIGRQVRKYFIECERENIAKSKAENQPAVPRVLTADESQEYLLYNTLRLTIWARRMLGALSGLSRDTIYSSGYTGDQNIEMIVEYFPEIEQLVSTTESLIMNLVDSVKNKDIRCKMRRIISRRLTQDQNYLAYW